ALVPLKITAASRPERSPNAAMSTQVLTLFTFISSFFLRAPSPRPETRKTSAASAKVLPGVSPRRGRLLAKRVDDRRLQGYSPSLPPMIRETAERVAETLLRELWRLGGRCLRARGRP